MGMGLCSRAFGAQELRYYICVIVSMLRISFIEILACDLCRLFFAIVIINSFFRPNTVYCFRIGSNKGGIRYFFRAVSSLRSI